jgi:hypothetical protein
MEKSYTAISKTMQGQEDKGESTNLFIDEDHITMQYLCIVTGIREVPKSRHTHAQILITSPNGKAGNQKIVHLR